MAGGKVITMCLNNRPEYTRQVLSALRACTGVADYLLLPHVEPGCDEVRALVEGIDFAECLPTFNTARLGVNLNTENALLDGFSFADFVIHVEDDIICSADALRYYEWCREQYRADAEVFSVTGYNRRTAPAAPEDVHTVRRRKWFHPWGWATWRDRWELFAGLLHSRRTTWDVQLNHGFCAGGRSPRCLEVYPVLSRSQNIGLVSSRSTVPPEWYRENHYLQHWAGNHAVPDGAFHD